MREILFRAYDFARKEYLSAGNIFIAINAGIRPNTSEQYLDILERPDTYKERFAIEQYTGLTDKNGKKIFEGDIVYAYDVKYETFSEGNIENNTLQVWEEPVEEIHSKGAVVWNDGSYDIDDEIGYCSLSWFGEDGIEVIGSIHDNPELLKDGEK